MSSDGGHRHRPPSAGGPQGPKAPDDPKYAGGGVEADREWARQRIASFYRAREADRAQAPILRKAEEARHAPASKPAPGAWRTRLTGGAPLPGEVRARMEPQLGADLSGVKVHNDGAAAEAAQGFGARTFTVGNDVHFNAGQYAPGTRQGDELIAHELTHVAQGQKSGVQRKPAEQRQGEEGDHQAEGAEVSQPGEPAELEADAVAEGVADKLHGGAEHAAEGGAAGEAGKQKAPAIGAKLDGKIHLAGKDPLRSSTRNALGSGPEVSGMRVGNAQQAGVQRAPRHHVLPQEYRAWFAARGVDVDQFCVEMKQGQGEHSALHTMEWNVKIMGEMQKAEKREKHKLAPAEIIAIAKDVMAQFQVSGSFVPFKDGGGGDEKKKK